MLGRRSVVVLVVAACGHAPAPVPITAIAPPASKTPPPSPPLVQSAGRGCDLDGAETVELGPHDTLAVVTCSPNTPTDDAEWPVRAYLVRRTSPTTGTEELLGDWMQGHESGGYWAIAGVVKDHGQVTRVIVEEVHGGLDQRGDYHLEVYDPARGTWTGQDVHAPSARIETAPDGSVTIMTCTETVTEIDPSVACEDSANPALATIVVR